MTDLDIINASHLPDYVRPKCENKNITNVELENIDQKTKEIDNFEIQTLDSLEKKIIFMTLQKLNGNKSKTAKALGITIKTLYNKLHHHGMDDFIKN